MTAPALQKRLGKREGIDVVFLLADLSLTLDNSPVFQSQVMDWLNVQARNGISAGVVCGVIDAARFQSTIRPNMGGVTAIETFSLSRAPVTVWRAARSMRRLHRQHPTRAIYVRGIWGSVAYRLAFPLAGPRLAFDFRGDIVEEARYAGRAGLRLWLLKRLTSWAIGQADAATAVSSYGARVLQEQYGQKRAQVIPSCVEAVSWERDASVRASVRRDLGISDGEIVLVYSGGLSRYQLIPEMLDLWSRLQKTADGLRFLLLTNDTPTHLQTDLDSTSARGPARLIVRTVPRAEVPGYLAAADIGFLLREKHPLNAVASPVKFGEYVASGLAIVASPGLGDVGAAIRDSDLGALADPADLAQAERACIELINRVRSGRAAYRDRAQAFARARVDWQAYVPAWRKLIGMPS